MDDVVSHEEGAPSAQDALVSLKGAKQAGLWVFCIVGAVLLAASTAWLGLKNDWGLPKDIFAWVEAAVAALASIASATAASLTVNLRSSKIALTQVVQANDQLTQQLHDASVSNHTENSHNYTEHNTTNNTTAPLHPEVADKLADVAEHLHKLEGMITPLRSNPEHVRQLNDFIDRARTNRVLELENQLAEDVKIFDRIRELLTTLVTECERARIATASKRSP